MFAAAAVLVLVFLLGCFVIPESLRWLVQRGRAEQAADVLRRFGGEAYARHALGDIREHSSKGPVARCAPSCPNLGSAAFS